MYGKTKSMLNHQYIRAHTFIKIQRAHGVTDDCLKLVKPFAALQELLGQALVQISAAHHRLSQDHLLKLRQECGIHWLFGNNNRARLKSWKTKQICKWEKNKLLLNLSVCWALTSSGLKCGIYFEWFYGFDSRIPGYTTQNPDLTIPFCVFLNI